MTANLTSTVQTVLDDETVARAAAWSAPGLPHPSVGELRALAEIAPQAKLRVVKLCRGNTLVALAVCYVERALIHGVNVVAYRSFGDKLHDYTRLYAADGFALSRLLDSVRQDARECGADVVDLNNQLVLEWLDAIPASQRSASKTGLFDARLAPEGWQEILGRKSVRRHWKKAAKHPGYRAETVVGTFVRKDIEELAALHRERWRFAGVRSAFENPRRLEEYLCSPANKVFTKVMLGREMLCCHYGMLYDDLLLWHTPLINIKLLDLSPLSTLLAETAQVCEQTGLRYLDLGLGDESYKDYSSNTTRQVYEILIPVSPKGWGVHLVHRHGRPERVKAALTQLGTVVRRIPHAIRVCFTKIYWYEATQAKPLTEPPHNVSVIQSYEAFVDFSRQYAMPVLKRHYHRFREGCFFVVFHTVHEVRSYGWGQKSGEFYVEETDQRLFLGDRILLFDFETPASQRNKGYFTELLVSIRGMLGNDLLAIFARSDNHASNKAIRKAGFCRAALPPSRPAATAPT